MRVKESDQNQLQKPIIMDKGHACFSAQNPKDFRTRLIQRTKPQGLEDAPSAQNLVDFRTRLQPVAYMPDCSMLIGCRLSGPGGHKQKRYVR